jgi:DNA-binding transcriptional regulator YiaG
VDEMPRKIRQLKADLRRAVSLNSGGAAKAVIRGGITRWSLLVTWSWLAMMAMMPSPTRKMMFGMRSRLRPLSETEMIMSRDVEYIDVRDEDEAAARRYAQIIEWSTANDAFIVSVPDIPGLRTHGSTPEEAAAMGNEAIALWLAGARASGIVPPSPAFSARHVSFARSPDAERIRHIRQTLDASQREFAAMLNVSVATVRSWEQGLRKPDGASRRLLEIAERQPDVLLEAIGMS